MPRFVEICSYQFHSQVLEDSLQALQRGNPAAAKNAKSLGRLLSVAASKRIRGGDGETLVKLSDILSGNDDEEGCEAGVDQRLLGYDEDGDGYLNKEELRNAVRGELDAIRRAGDEAVRRKRITLALIGVAVLLVVVLAVNSGLTYAVVKMSHQTSMSESDPQMRVRDTETVVQTASADFKVVDGSLVPRSSENDNEVIESCGNYGSQIILSYFICRSFCCQNYILCLIFRVSIGIGRMRQAAMLSCMPCMSWNTCELTEI